MFDLHDIFRGHYPHAFVFIGGKVIAVQSYNLTSTNTGEIGSANVTIPLENIDSSIFADTSVVDNIYAISIWSGYLQDVADPEKQKAELLKAIVTKDTKQRQFVKRFDGYVLQPEWKIGSENTLTLSCLDWSGILKDNKFYRSLEGGKTEAREIVKMINEDFSGVDIILDKYNGSVKLGEYDEQDKKIVYNASGKTYFEVLEEIAKNLGMVVYSVGTTIRITKSNSSPLLWPMYYGPGSDLKDSKGIPKGQLFTELEFRFGAKGRSDKSNVVIEVLGTNFKKKGKESKVRVIYPENSAKLSNTKFVRHYISGDTNESQAKVIAEQLHKQNSKRLITGTIDLPFANPFINLFDIIQFVFDDSEQDKAVLQGYTFSVNTVNESYGPDGYTQTIEFDSDPDLENPPKQRIAFKEVSVKPLGKRGKRG